MIQTWKRFISIQRRFTFSLLFSFFLVSPLQAAVYFYVDPDWAGSQKTGAASTPWTDLSLAQTWKTIDAALVADDVVVYFSARAATQDVNQISSLPLKILRTDQSVHWLTLDGMSKYNSNDSAPSWLTYGGNSRFEINSSIPINTTNNNPQNPEKRVNFTVRGFKALALTGQSIIITYSENVIIEDNEVTHVPCVAGQDCHGPGLLIGHIDDGGGGLFGRNVTIRSNFIHDTFGEGLYISGLQSATKGARSGPGHHDVLVEDNLIVDPGTRGGEPDAIDPKDGVVGFTIRGNVLKATKPGTLRDGINLTSGALVERNYVFGFGRAGIALVAVNNAFPTRAGTIVRNNIVVNTGGNSEFSNNLGIWVTGSTTGDNFTDAGIYNNTVYGVDGIGIFVSQFASGLNLQNNIVANSTQTNLIVESSASLSTHNNNLFFTSGSGTTLVKIDKQTFNAANITAFESLSISQNPELVNPADSTSEVNFKLKASSPAVGKGTVLKSFSDDFFEVARGTVWDIGAAEFSVGGVEPPGAPTGLKVITR